MWDITDSANGTTSLKQEIKVLKQKVKRRDHKITIMESFLKTPKYEKKLVCETYHAL